MLADITMWPYMLILLMDYNNNRQHDNPTFVVQYKSKSDNNWVFGRETETKNRKKKIEKDDRLIKNFVLVQKFGAFIWQSTVVLLDRVNRVKLKVKVL